MTDGARFRTTLFEAVLVQGTALASGPGHVPQADVLSQLGQGDLEQGAASSRAKPRCPKTSMLTVPYSFTQQRRNTRMAPSGMAAPVASRNRSSCLRRPGSIASGPRTGNGLRSHSRFYARYGIRDTDDQPVPAAVMQ